MLKNKKMKVCKHCGEEIAKSAKICPKCGGKNKKNTLLTVILVLLVIGAIGNAINKDETGVSDSKPTTVEKSQNKEKTEQVNEKQENAEKEEKIEYIQYSVDELMEDLDNNALKAKNKYDDKYLSLTGKLSVIDSSGKYISITPVDKDFAIIGVQCYVKDKSQLDRILDMSIDDIITVQGKITEVGEVFGYSLNIDNIN